MIHGQCIFIMHQIFLEIFDEEIWNMSRDRHVLSVMHTSSFSAEIKKIKDTPRDRVVKAANL